MIAVYLRVSTEDQKQDSQRREIKRWATSQKIKPTALQWFEDKATGNNMQRPALAELQAQIAKGKIDTVLLYRFDRLSRSLFDGVEILGDWCRRGLRVVVVTQDIDLKGTEGQIVASVLFGMAEIEQKARRQRQAAGIAAAKKRGVYDRLEGRPVGSTKAKPQRARELAEQGLKVGEIAAALNIHRSTAGRYLKQTA